MLIKLFWLKVYAKYIRSCYETRPEGCARKLWLLRAQSSFNEEEFTSSLPLSNLHNFHKKSLDTVCATNDAATDFLLFH